MSRLNAHRLAWRLVCCGDRGKVEIVRSRSFAPLESAGLQDDVFVKIKAKLAYASDMPLTVLNSAC